MPFDSVGDDINRFLRNVLIAGALTVAALICTAYDIGKHRHRAH